MRIKNGCTVVEIKETGGGGACDEDHVGHSSCTNTKTVDFGAAILGWQTEAVVVADTFVEEELMVKGLEVHLSSERAGPDQLKAFGDASELDGFGGRETLIDVACFLNCTEAFLENFGGEEHDETAKNEFGVGAFDNSYFFHLFGVEGGEVAGDGGVAVGARTIAEELSVHFWVFKILASLLEITEGDAVFSIVGLRGELLQGVEVDVLKKFVEVKGESGEVFFEESLTFRGGGGGGFDDDGEGRHVLARGF